VLIFDKLDNTIKSGKRIDSKMAGETFEGRQTIVALLDEGSTFLVFSKICS